MAKRKYTGTDAELLRLKREGLSLRAIAAEVGIGKSVVGARIARAEAAERVHTGSPASTQAISTPAASKAASATTPSDPHVAGPVDVRAELTRLVNDPRTGKREVLGALAQLQKMDEAGSPVGHEWSPPLRIGVEPQPQADGSPGRWRIWIRADDGWQIVFSDCDAELATAWLYLMLFSAEDKEGVRAALEGLIARRDGSRPTSTVLDAVEEPA